MKNEDKQRLIHRGIQVINVITCTDFLGEETPNNEQIAEALKILQPGIDRACGDAFYLRGLLFEKVRNARAAISDYSTALSISTTFIDAPSRLRRLCLKEGPKYTMTEEIEMYEEGLKGLKTDYRLRERLVKVLKTRATMRMVTEEYDQSLSDLTRASELAPDDPEIKRSLQDLAVIAYGN
ncbi:tetratricopeptide repeat protein [Nanoarchaeota archaeon]